MNSKTTKIVNFINTNDKYKNKIAELRSKYTNSKDFGEHMLKYVVMEILKTEKQFYDYPRKDIQLDEIMRRYF